MYLKTFDSNSERPKLHTGITYFKIISFMYNLLSFYII